MSIPERNAALRQVAELGNTQPHPDAPAPVRADWLERLAIAYDRLAEVMPDLAAANRAQAQSARKRAAALRAGE